MAIEAETREAEQLFERLAARFLAAPTVDLGTGFGSNPGLRVGSKIFAMLRNSDLVVKLPKQRVDELVASGAGARFDPRHDGRRMSRVPWNFGGGPDDRQAASTTS